MVVMSRSGTEYHRAKPLRDWEALRWRELEWSDLPKAMLKGLISCLSLEDSVSLNNAMTSCEARPHLLKAYKGIRSPAFDQHVYTGKEDFRGLRWAIEQGVDLQGIRLEMGVEKRAGKVLRMLVGCPGDEEKDLEIAEYYATRGKLENVDEAVGMETGQTALMGAPGGGHLEIVKGLLAGGANKDKARDGGVTPLFIAAREGHIAAVEALLKVGADKDKAKDDGATPLFIAAQKGHEEIVELLQQAAQK